jgi:hypothetical protein
LFYFNNADFLCHCVLGDTGVWTQGVVLASQVEPLCQPSSKSFFLVLDLNLGSWPWATLPALPFFFFWWHQCLNSGPHACLVGAVTTGAIPPSQ